MEIGYEAEASTSEKKALGAAGHKVFAVRGAYDFRLPKTSK